MSPLPLRRGKRVVLANDQDRFVVVQRDQLPKRRVTQHEPPRIDVLPKQTRESFSTLRLTCATAVGQKDVRDGAFLERPQHLCF